MNEWHEDRRNLAAVARYMGERGDSVDDVAYMLEKPEKFGDDWQAIRSGLMTTACPTCGPTTSEQHPRRSGVTRCGNCKEWLQSADRDADLDARVAAFNAAYCRPRGPLREQDDAYWDAPIHPEVGK